MPITLTDCQKLDAQDALASMKAHFNLPSNVIYLDGNSLGAMPKQSLARATDLISQEWGVGLIRSWNTANWFALPENLGNKLGKLIGANEGETIVTDTTSLNLFKALAAAVSIQQKDNPSRRIIVSERDNFPTDLYMIEGLISLMQQGYELRLIDENLSLEQALTDDVAVLALSHVNYRTGALYDMADVNAQAHAKGILTIWDLAHSAGALPIRLADTQSDFAIGCTYKYLNGGPGSPAFIWVAKRHQNLYAQPLSGWWSHLSPFKMAPNYQPAQGIRQFLCGTQAITSMAMVECGLDIALQVEMEAIRSKSLALTDLFIQLVEERCAGHGLTLVTPREHSQRGSQVSLARNEGAYAIVQALIARGVIGDYRKGNQGQADILRFGFTPLYLSFAEVWQAVEHLRQILVSGEWRQAQFNQIHAVT